MNFFIKKDSTLPELVFPITQKLMEKYNLTDEMFENVAVTFSMVNAKSGAFKIANSSGSIFINDDPASHPTLEKFSLIFNFESKHTSTAGNYSGEFVVDFLGETCANKLKLPIDDVINIKISDTITRTTLL